MISIIVIKQPKAIFSFFFLFILIRINDKHKSMDAQKISPINLLTYVNALVLEIPKIFCI